MRVTGIFSAAALAMLFQGASSLPTIAIRDNAEAEAEGTSQSDAPAPAPAVTTTAVAAAAATATAASAAATATVVPDNGLTGTPHGRDAERILDALRGMMYDPNAIWEMLGPAVQLGPNSKAGRLRNGPVNAAQAVGDAAQKVGDAVQPGPLRRRGSDLEPGFDGLPGEDGVDSKPSDTKDDDKTSATASADDAAATTNNGTNANAGATGYGDNRDNGEKGGDHGYGGKKDLVQNAYDEAIVEDVSVSVAVSDSCANCYNVLQLIII